MAYRAVQTRVLYSLAIIPRNLHGTPHSIQFRVDLNTLTRSRSIHNRDKRSLCNAAHSRALRIYSCYSHATTRRVPSKHAFTTARAAYALLCVITFRCSSSLCSSFIAFCPLLRPTEHIARPIPTPFCFCPHASRQTRLSASGLPTDAYRYATRLHFARFARDIFAISPQKPIHARFCRRTAVRRPASTLSAPSIPASGAGERISLRSRFMWNTRLVIHQNLNVYRGFCSFMHIYTLRHCMFFRLCVCFFRPCDPFPVVAPRLTIAPQRCSAAFVSEPRIAARLAVFVGARLHSVFPRSCLPLFCFLDLFLPHAPWRTANFLFVFLCFRLFALSLR